MTDPTTEPTEEPTPAESAAPEEAPAEIAEAEVMEAQAPEKTESDLQTEQLAKMKEQLLRTAADFDNFRKRSRRDIEDASRRAKEHTLLELLPLVDNLERAVGAAGSAQDVEAVISGVQMVLRSFQDISSRLRLERVETLGVRFDPTVHDAVQQVETAEFDPGTVVAEVTPGYKLEDRLLRAALVVVARPPAN